MKSDQLVIMSLIALLIIHIVVWIVGYFTHKLSYSFSFLNAVIAVGIIAFWAVNQLRIQQHFIEAREIVVLCFELLVAAVSIFVILSPTAANSFKIMQCIVFGIHLTVLVAMLAFMLTFKMNRLF